MRWHTHALFGLCSLWLLEIVPGGLTSRTLPLTAALSVFGALLPDLDAAESKIRSLSVGGISPFAPVSEVAHRAWGHRGFLHSPGAALLLLVPLLPLGYWWGWPYALALWLGYTSHLVADACTKTGLPGWPRKGRLFLLPERWRIRTGSQAEEALLPLLAAAALFLLLRHLPFIG